jgi:hypothetical protein
VRPQAVARWHTLLRAIAVLNIALWTLGAIAVARAHASILQLLLSAVYVAGCAFRSILPVIDIPRLVLIDSRLSSVSIGRSVATVAELCFAAQWALLLHRIASLSGSPWGQTVSFAVVPLIVIAEGCSWYAVLTTGQRAHAVENALWGLSAALVVAATLLIGPQRLTALNVPVIAWCLGGAAYVAFIYVYDVPMYWSRWRADQAREHRYLTLREGMVDIRTRRAVSYRWEDWKDEVSWMSLYFTFGVWSSISLIYTSLAIGHALTAAHTNSR